MSEVDELKRKIETLERENQELKQLLSETEKLSKIGSYKINLKTEAVEWTKGLYEIFGLTLNDELPTSEHYYDFVHINDKDKVKQMFIDSTTNGVPFDLKYKIVLKNGVEKNVHSKSEVITDDAGNKNLFGFFRDITEERKLVKDIQDSNNKFQLLFDTLQEGISLNKAIYDDDGNIIDQEIVFVNEAFNKYSHFSTKEVVGRRATEVYDISSNYIKQFWIDRKNKEFPIYTEMKRRNNRWVYICTSNVKDGIIVNAFMDITETKKKEILIRESEKKFRALFEQTVGYCMILDPNTSDGIPIIIDANEAACKLHGYSKDEFIGRPVSDIDDEEGKKLVKKRTQEILTGKPFYIENVHVRKDGSTFPVAVNASKIVVDDGKKPLILTNEFDITEQKRNQELLNESLIKYKTLVENTAMGIVTLNEDKILFANSFFAEFCCTPKEKLIHSSFNRYLVDDDKKVFNSFLKYFERTSSNYAHTLALRFKDGTKKVKFTEAIFFEVKNENERILQVIVNDVTSLTTIKNKSKHVFADAVYLSGKLNRFEAIKENIEKTIINKKLDYADFESIFSILNEERNLEQLWTIFKANIDLIHEDFLKKLLSRAPNLTQQELKHCSFIKMNFETKEIAQLFNVKPTSIQIGRVRIKKKLKLKSEDDLISYIMTL